MVIDSAAFSSLTRMYGYDSRSAITGITLIAGLASTVGWPISALLEHSMGWRGACAIWAALHLLLGLPINAWALHYGRGATVEEPTAVKTEPRAAQSSDYGILLLGFMFTASGMVSIGMATNLPRLFAVIGATPAAAIAAASLLGPAQVAARILEFSARHRINPLISARIASALHPLASLVVAVGGPQLIVVFSVVHGAGNGLLTICRGTLPLALYGPEGYGARIGRISAPARIGQALAPFLFGLAIEKMGAATLLISSGLSLAALAVLSRIHLPSNVSGRQFAQVEFPDQVAAIVRETVGLRGACRNHCSVWEDFFHPMAGFAARSTSARIGGYRTPLTSTAMAAVWIPCRLSIPGATWQSWA
jgi:hypothetical protein